MGKRAVSLLVVGAMLASGAQAADREARRAERAAEREAKSQVGKEENIGLGSGAAIGAAAGGPVGFILGGALGAWLGDRFHQEKTARAESDEKHRVARAEADGLATRLTASERRSSRMESELRAADIKHRSQLSQALAIDVLFRTEDSALDGETELQLAQLAGLVGPIDGTMIRVEGHTDARGTEKYNAELAAARAASVRDALVRAGMPAERIVVSAAGESNATAAEQDIDGLALERRVAVSIMSLEDAQRVAQQD